MERGDWQRSRRCPDKNRPGARTAWHVDKGAIFGAIPAQGADDTGSRIRGKSGMRAADGRLLRLFPAVDDVFQAGISAIRSRQSGGRIPMAAPVGGIVPTPRRFYTVVPHNRLGKKTA